MKPEPWTQSHDCRSGAHCRACQDPTEQGRGFRLSLLRGGFTGLPENGDAPVCPYGMNPPPLDGMTDDERELLAAAENPDGWGDHVAAAIHKVGADRAYKMLRRLTGLTANCACNERRKTLNRLEGWVKGIFG
jgi:hypothetical protein